MVEIQTQPQAIVPSAKLANPMAASAARPISAVSVPPDATNGSQYQAGLDSFSPVHQNGCFEFDRVIKSGYVQKRTQKTKVSTFPQRTSCAVGLRHFSRIQAWKTAWLVLRPNTLYIYRSEKEDKLRRKVYLSDLTAVMFLKDPKQKRKNVFGLFSPSKNFHFEAPSSQDAQEWVELIRHEARIEQEEEEMFLASPAVQRHSFNLGGFFQMGTDSSRVLAERDRLASSSPEPPNPSYEQLRSPAPRRTSQTADYSGLSGNEVASHSDFSDTEGRLQGASFENLAVKPPPSAHGERPVMTARNPSQISGLNLDQDPDRVIWQGWLWYLRSKRGVKQWKNCWAVLRPRNFILYKDETEYAAQFIANMSTILNVVELDPISRTKRHCLQIITEEKSYRFAAHDEESLVRCLGAFKSLLAKRRELEARAAAAAATGGVPS
ncbi:uncharacterized protein E0L32_009554 [Thyridium curvatum]|uniref:PH domain-containing protein n=1 Tax=Thyridium curvatum TaxID=1093900 RepID=A0A507AGP9_9PEZI|nr:uncharacterized protein E0L32_009554 [Thyridium curvatum]TPX08975.1 hypothetical protein E0L32_009554 [Thyridium curvatum]